MVCRLSGVPFREARDSEPCLAYAAWPGRESRPALLAIADAFPRLVFSVSRWYISRQQILGEELFSSTLL